MKCSRCSAQAVVEIVKESATGRDTQHQYLCGDCRNADVWDHVNWIRITEIQIVHTKRYIPTNTYLPFPDYTEPTDDIVQTKRCTYNVVHTPSNTYTD